MIFAVAAMVALCLYKIKFAGSQGFSDYMLPQKTGSIKGLFVIIVLFSHIRQHVTFDRTIAMNDAFYWVMTQLGQLMVVVFFFYSGYGIMQALGKKGITYVHSMPKNRILKTWLHFAFAILLFLITNYCIGKTFPIERILLSLTAWTAVGNSAWFMFAVFIMYIATYLAFLVARGKKVAGTVIVTLLMAVYVAVMWIIKGEKDHWFFDTALCYPLGMWYSLAKPKIDAKLLPSFKKWLAVMLAGIAVFVALNAVYCSDRKQYRYIFVIEALVFAVDIALLSMRVSADNEVLRWFGKRVFSIYMLQRIPMIVLDYFGVSESPYVFAWLVFVLSLVIAEAFDRLTAKTDKLIKL